MYRLRNRFVHDAIFDEITPKDLHELDQLLMNILTNIANNIKLLNSRDAFIENTSKHLAREVLNIKQPYKMKLTYREWNHDVKDSLSWNWA